MKIQEGDEGHFNHGLAMGESQESGQSTVEVASQGPPLPGQSAQTAGGGAGIVGGISSLFTFYGKDGKGAPQTPHQSSQASKYPFSSSLKPPPPSDYARNIGDHFISFIQQLDQFFDQE